MTTAYATNEVIIRDCTPADLDVVHALHVDAVLHSTAIWQEEPHPRRFFDAWLTSRQADGYPVVVAEVEGAVAGYATYSQWRPHQGYRHTVEHSVYVVETFRGRGVASTLVAALRSCAVAEGRHVMMAGICSANTGSIRLHEKLGFETVATVPEVGRKFGRWLDLTLMRLQLS